MGLVISDILPRDEIDFSELKNKTLVVDASNAIYQFLSTIRQPDGTPLQNSKGKVTSHISGLFYRNINLMMDGIKLIYVFDGKPPELKNKTKQARLRVKEAAKEKYERAKAEEDVSAMRRYAQQLTHLTPEIVQESKELLQAMGIAVIQAPSEGESQASEISKTEDIDGVVSQDYDCLLFGAPRLIRNLTVSRRRKTQTGYVSIYPEVITLEKVLNTLQINQDQLICLGILIGTDYNKGGIKGIGQKRALEIVQRLQYPAVIFDSLKETIEKSDNPFDWEEIFHLFKKPDIKHNVEIKFPEVDQDKIREIMIENDFAEDRITNQIKKLDQLEDKKKQKGISEYF